MTEFDQQTQSSYSNGQDPAKQYNAVAFVEVFLISMSGKYVLDLD